MDTPIMPEHSPGLIQHYKNLANQTNPIDSDAITARNAAQYWLDKNGYSQPVKRSKSLLKSLADLFGGKEDVD
jgi:hypothetical protein